MFEVFRECKFEGLILLGRGCRVVLIWDRLTVKWNDFLIFCVYDLFLNFVIAGVVIWEC